MTIKLIRVPYGKKSTPVELREYRINNSGPVGTLEEFRRAFPEVDFQIMEEPKDLNTKGI